MKLIKYLNKILTSFLILVVLLGSIFVLCLLAFRLTMPITIIQPVQEVCNYI